jgi:AraC-like DNA-binding protein
VDTIRVVRSQVADGTVELAARPPDARLREHVVRLTGYSERLKPPVRYRELPPPFAVLIVNIGTPYRVFTQDDAVADEQPGSFAGGLTERPVVIESDGAARCVQIDLAPLSAARALGVPMRELTGRVVSLGDVVGADARRLEERLDEAPDWPSRLSLVERFVLDRLGDSQPARPDVTYAWRRLAETGGTIRITDLARELRCSRKHLTTQFHEHVGLAPKAAARLLRFNRSAALLRRGVGAAEVAFRCGYADQAHFSNEFREFSGSTPGAFAA